MPVDGDDGNAALAGDVVPAGDQYAAVCMQSLGRVDDPRPPTPSSTRLAKEEITSIFTRARPT